MKYMILFGRDSEDRIIRMVLSQNVRPAIHHDLPAGL